MRALRYLSICPGTLLALLPGLGWADAQTADASRNSAVLVELFTSEGCSSCPPADELLAQIEGRQSSEGQLIVSLSEHVTYWNSLGWKDPYSSEAYTNRQNGYGNRFRLDSVFTPQMVVNGREQLVGGDRRALETAFKEEAQQRHIELHIRSAHPGADGLTFSYSATELPQRSSLELFAVLADDTDRSSVSRGENSGRVLRHVAVARSITLVGPLSNAEERSVSLPRSWAGSPETGHHLVIFAQEKGFGPILGVDTRAF